MDKSISEELAERRLRAEARKIFGYIQYKRKEPGFITSKNCTQTSSPLYTICGNFYAATLSKAMDTGLLNECVTQT